MPFRWQDAFTESPEFHWTDLHTLEHPPSITTLENLKRFLDLVHIKFCLLRPFFDQKNYPLLQPQDMLPSFEASLYEYVNLPGFSLVAFERPLNYFQEIFQFDILHSVQDTLNYINGPATPFEPVIIQQNHQTFLSRLPKALQERFHSSFHQKRTRITNLQHYPQLLRFLLYMDRGHVLAKNSDGDFYFSGIYGSFPSDLDSELKRFGLRIGKFKPSDNNLYELNRNFVYQFLMELYGFPIASERRTSAALFARRLFKMGEDFLIRVLGQSDRTLTTLYSASEHKKYPKVEKIALVSVNKLHRDQLRKLDQQGYLIKDGQPAVILKVHYRQHKYDPNNVRTDRALSVADQEIIHPMTGATKSSINILKDTTVMTVTLNDIVKGEYYGRIKYKRNEIVENTETHSKRLKFLYAWLRKHQRRIIGYSDEFFFNISKVLDNYLLNPENYDVFEGMSDIYHEVWQQYSYIQQARKIKELEDLRQKKHKGSKVNYLEMLQQASGIMQELKFDIVKFFDSLVLHALNSCDDILSDPYLNKKYIEPPTDSLTEYGLAIRKQYGILVKLQDEIKAIRRTRRESRTVPNPS
jgi:hypothetical protein